MEPSDWRRDLSYDLCWDPCWHRWRIPTPLWFWEEDEKSGMWITQDCPHCGEESPPVGLDRYVKSDLPRKRVELLVAQRFADMGWGLVCPHCKNSLSDNKPISFIAEGEGDE